MNNVLNFVHTNRMNFGTANALQQVKWIVMILKFVQVTGGNLEIIAFLERLCAELNITLDENIIAAAIIFYRLNRNLSDKQIQKLLDRKYKLGGVRTVPQVPIIPTVKQR